MENFQNSSEEIGQQLGQAVRRIRLLRNLDRETLAHQAGVSVSALKNLESGKGSTTHTLVKVVRALGKAEWFRMLAPAVTINPLSMVKDQGERRRASGKKAKDGKQTPN